MNQRLSMHLYSAIMSKVSSTGNACGQIKARSYWAAAKDIFFPSRMGNIGLYGAVHMDTCGKGNSKGVIINWVLCPIVTATATTKFPLPLPQLSVNEPLGEKWFRWKWTINLCWPVIETLQKLFLTLFWSLLMLLVQKTKNLYKHLFSKLGYLLIRDQYPAFMEPQKQRWWLHFRRHHPRLIL